MFYTFFPSSVTLGKLFNFYISLLSSASSNIISFFFLYSMNGLKS